MPIFAPFGFIVEKLFTPIIATGGQISTIISASEAYQVHYFTSSGDFTVLSGDDSVEYLIVGGGGGSAEFSGGGGAGGVLTGNLFPNQQTYSVVVGGGGPGVLVTAIGNAGTGSSAFGLTAIGGGAGAGSSVALQGGTGGSGGGGSPRNGAAGLGTSPQGRNGGTGRSGYVSGNDGGSGGGGGAVGSGGNGGTRTGGAGGAGLDISNTFSSLFSAPVFSGSLNKSGYVAGGGGGMGDSRNGTSTAGTRGQGGGGQGGKVAFTVDNENGYPNSGGGAGGGTPGGDGLSGGSGLVLVKYKGGIGDSDAIAFINAVATLDTTEQTAINDLVSNLKDAGVWSKMTAVYPLIGGTAASTKWNLVNPQDTNAAFRINWGGGITFDSNGITGNGTTGYGTTNINASTGLNGGAAQDDNHVFAYLRVTSADNGIDIGVSDSGTATSYHFNSRNGSNIFNTRNMSGTLDSQSSVTNTTGVFGMSRISSSEYVKFINKSKSTVTRASSTPPPRNIFLMANNANGVAGDFQPRNMALVTFGAGLTSDEIDDLVDINQTFQTTLGRFV
jgi:hypothetical protein